MTWLNVLAQNDPLTAAGWAMMIGCVGLVCGLMVFCFRRVLGESSPSKHHHAPLDIDTQDTEG